MKTFAPLALLVALLLFPNPGRGESLSSDTVWEGRVTPAGSVRVEPGATLTVRAGAVVTFAAGGLEVAGRLVAEKALFTGKDWQGIVLKGCDEETLLREVRIEGARTGLLVTGGAPRLLGLTLAGNGTGMELRQKTAAEVADSLFSGNGRVGLFVKDDALPRIDGNRFEHNGKFGAYIHRSTPASFRGNRFRGNPTGLAVSNFGSDPRIEGNLFEENELGILVDRAARPVISGNRLEGNGTGLRLYRRSDAQVEGNRFGGTGVAVSVAYSSYPRIAGNDFAGPGQALFLEFQSARWEADRGAAAREEEVAARGAFGGAPRTQVTEEERRASGLDGTVDARGNWWGEAGTAELHRIGPGGNPSFIHDGRDAPTFIEGGKSYPLDTVRFAPWSETPLTAGKARPAP